MSARRHPAMRAMCGFTLVELVMVMVVIGILAVVALPRFLDKTFEERALHDGAKALLQHARHVAVATRRYTCVAVAQGSGNAGSLSLTMDARLPESFTTVSCSTAIAIPTPNSKCAATNQVCAPSGTSILTGSSPTVIFDPLGRSVSTTKAAAANLTVKTSNQTDITIYGDTGYVE